MTKDSNKKRKIQDTNNNSTSIIVSYRFDGHVRFVEPYVHEFTSFTKGRWLGRQIIDVVTKEFGAHPESYWERALQLGFIRINGQHTDRHYVFKNSDRFTHLTHRHEPPVSGRIAFVGETEAAFAVNKPASMPVHPCGAYRYNSMMMLLAQEPLVPQQVAPLHLVHRIDRVTSGLVVLAKSSEAAASISQEIREHTAEKTYLARVRGRFPAQLSHMKLLTDAELSVLPEAGVDDELEEDGTLTPKHAAKSSNIQGPGVRLIPSFEETGRAPGVGYGRSARLISSSSSSSASSSSQVGEKEEFLFVRCPIAVVSYREGIHSCDSTGKLSLSAFRSLGYDESTDTSLVECRPFTGRTHQLRLHLQFVGNPIANDPCYGGEIFYGEPDKRAKAVHALQLFQQQGLKPMTKVPHFILHPDELAKIAGQITPAGVEDEETQKHDDVHVESIAIDTPQGPDESDAAFLGRTCRYCKGKLCGDVERWLHCDGIWLHALRYRGKKWAFETALPEWAINDNFQVTDVLKLHK